MPHDGEAEAETAVLARDAGVALAEALEHVRKELGADALPRVAHAHARVIREPIEANLHLPVLGREPHRVREEVPDDLLEAIRVARHDQSGAIDVELQREALGLRREADRVDGPVDHLGQVHSLDVEMELARDDARHVEQVLDELRLCLCVPLDALQGALDQRGRQLLGAEQLRVPEQRVEGCLQLV